MPVLDARPRDLDIKFRPGSVVTLNLNGPADWLDTRAYTATVNGVALSVSEDDDTLVIVASSVVTTALPTSGGPYQFVLTQTGGNVELVGQWTPSLVGSSSQTIDTAVVIDTLEVEVTIIGSGVGGGAPSGPAGGDLGGTYPDPTLSAGKQAELDAKATAAALTTETNTRAAADVALDGRVDALELAPPAHAATHADGGSDEITVAESQVTGLAAVVAARAPLDAGSVTGQLPAWDNDLAKYVPVIPSPVTAEDITVDTTGFDNSNAAEMQELAADFDAAITAKVAETITNGVTGIAPSQDAVFDALALKAPAANPVFTGTVAIPDGALAIADTNGLQAAIDGKVADAINDGTTTVAPSQNAVFDALALKAPATPTVGTGLGTTGTVNLDMAALHGTRQIIVLTGNIAFTISNLAAGRYVTVYIQADASVRTLGFTGFAFVGAPAPTSIAASKLGVLTVECPSGSAAVAAYAVQP